jgi:hypothetical protein
VVAPRSTAFVNAIKRFAAEHRVPLVDFAKGQRKDDVLHQYLACSDGSEQVLFIGRAQEKMTIFRTERRRNPICVFRLLPRGFTHRDLRHHLAPQLGLRPEDMTSGQITYDLRRLRLHGLIARIPHTHHYHVTDLGLRTALFLTRAHSRCSAPDSPRSTAHPSRPNSAPPPPPTNTPSTPSPKQPDSPHDHQPDLTRSFRLRRSQLR